MKTILTSVAALFVISHSSLVLAQGGSLTPPGAPAVLFKTLNEVEARTPISSVPFAITVSGSFYLTGNLAVTSGSGITIGASDVTLDLNGFTISSTASPAAGTAVLINSGRQNITIMNGNITGTTTVSGSTFTPGGFIAGINTVSTTSANVRVEGVKVRGMANGGITFTTTVATMVVEDCSVSVCVGTGISAYSVRSCSVGGVGGDAIFAETVADSHGETVSLSGLAAGIEATVVESSEGKANAGQGITAVTANNSHGTSNSEAGIFSNTATNCRGVSGTNTGLGAEIATNCEGVSGSGIGLQAEQASNCFGTSTSGSGLSSNQMAANCYGISTSGAQGLKAIGTANCCRGKRDGGVAIFAGIAIGCTVNGTGTVSSANKFLGTP